MAEIYVAGSCVLPCRCIHLRQVLHAAMVKSGADTYWKPTRQQPVDTASGFVEDHDTYWRQFHMMCYKSCRVDDMKKFISERGITLSQRIETTVRDHLIRALVSADKSPQFRRFFELPAEVSIFDLTRRRYCSANDAQLRNSVYTHYLAAFSDKLLHMPNMPPLARASKNLRTEVRPLFFGECIFEIRLVAASTEDAGWPKVGWALRMRPESVAFFATLDEKSLTSIKKLCLTVETKAWSVLACYVSIDKGGQSFTTMCRQEDPDTRADANRKHQKTAERFRNVEEAVTRVLKKMKTREGEEVMKLRLGDVYALRGAVERGWYGRVA